MVVVVAVGFVPKALKPPDAPKPVDVPNVGAVLVAPNPPRKEGVVVVAFPNPVKLPKLKEGVVVVPNVPKTVVVTGGVLKEGAIPNALLDEVTPLNPGVVPKTGVVVVPNVGAGPKPLVGVLPKAVAVGVPKLVPVPNPPVAGVDEVPKRLGADVAGVLNPKDGVPNAAKILGFKHEVYNNKIWQCLILYDTQMNSRERYIYMCIYLNDILAINTRFTTR